MAKNLKWYVLVLLIKYHVPENFGIKPPYVI